MVSVLLPAKDAEKFLSVSLESILNQYFTDFEVIVVTQESKDNTKDIADRYSNIDSRVKHFENRKTGVGSALNTALSVARGCQGEKN
jgi:glycosyltransferase involved in cell wall biosynthesis